MLSEAPAPFVRGNPAFAGRKWRRHWSVPFFDKYVKTIKKFEVEAYEKGIPLHLKHHEQIKTAIKLFSEKLEEVNVAISKTLNPEIIITESYSK